MTDFRTKFLGLAAVASLFAGVSYGQTLSCPGQLTPTPPNLYVAVQAGVNGTPSPASPLLLRAEGTTELVSDVVLTNCTSSSNVASAQVVVFMNQPVTSKVINTNTTANTEATLLVTSGGVTTPYSGTVSGSTVTFTSVSFPATFNMEIADIRVNATGTGATTSPVAVTESLFAGFNGQSTLSISAVTVGQALQSLVAPAFTLGANNLALVNNHVICVGNSLPLSGLPTLSFAINVGEVLGGFFKSGIVSQGVGAPPATEYGTYVNTGTGAGVPTHGTRIQLVMGGVPASATVYVPVSVTTGSSIITPQNPTNTFAAMQLTSGTTGGFSAVSPVATAALAASNVAALTPTNGVVTAVFEVTTSNPANIQTFSVPVYVIFAANAVTASQITVLESYAPNGSTDIPNFAASSATPLNASAITACVTNLLFPFVTSQLGFDTGIAISNTSTDPFGKFGAVPSGTTAPAGACTLNFYGAGAPSPAAVATPNIPSGTTYAFVNSSVAPGFQGYIIAQCPFVAGHGFGFVTNLGSAGNSAVAQGYIALSLPAANSGATKRIFPTSSTTEQVGQ
jgi:hypothetical protein